MTVVVVVDSHAGERAAGGTFEIASDLVGKLTGATAAQRVEDAIACNAIAPREPRRELVARSRTIAFEPARERSPRGPVERSEQLGIRIAGLDHAPQLGFDRVRLGCASVVERRRGRHGLWARPTCGSCVVPLLGVGEEPANFGLPWRPQPRQLDDDGIAHERIVEGLLVVHASQPRRQRQPLGRCELLDLGLELALYVLKSAVRIAWCRSSLQRGEDLVLARDRFVRERRRRELLGGLFVLVELLGGSVELRRCVRSSLVDRRTSLRDRRPHIRDVLGEPAVHDRPASWIAVSLCLAQPLKIAADTAHALRC
ncbi:MAG TPA: hypothetical protein VGF94_24180 [Kofleriaceae bacterium]